MQKDDPAYGAPRVTAELNDGVDARELRRRVRTTVPAPADQHVPDLLSRDFTTAAPIREFVGDITYLQIATGGFLHLTTVIDCCSQALVGWAVADHMRTSLVTDALGVAAAARGCLGGAVFTATTEPRNLPHPT